MMYGSLAKLAGWVVRIAREKNKVDRVYHCSKRTRVGGAKGKDREREDAASPH